MRVNLDSKALKDPRFKRMGKALAIDWHEALGLCFEVWNYAYEARSEFLTSEDVDAVVDRSGIAAAMVVADLAEPAGAQLRLRGVRTRIGFLEKQVDRARAGGKAKAEKQRTKKKASETASLLPNGTANGSASRSQTLCQSHADLDQALPPDQDQSPALDQDRSAPLALIPPSSLKPESSGTREAIAGFCDRFRSKYSSAYSVAKRDAGQMQTLVTKHGRAEVERRVAILFDAPPWRLSQNAPDIGTLAANWNQLVAPARAAGARNAEARSEPASAEQHAADAARGTSPW